MQHTTIFWDYINKFRPGKIHLDSQDYGWECAGIVHFPIQTFLPPTANEILYLILSNCGKECERRCSCFKAGLKCANICESRYRLCEWSLLQWIYKINTTILKNWNPMKPFWRHKLLMLGISKSESEDSTKLGPTGPWGKC